MGWATSWSPKARRPRNEETKGREKKQPTDAANDWLNVARRRRRCRDSDEWSEVISKIRQGPAEAGHQHLTNPDWRKSGDDAKAKGDDYAGGQDSSDGRNHVA